MEGEITNNGLIQKTAERCGRLSELAVGLTVNKLLEIAYDYIFYPFIIYKFGAIKGGVTMTLLTGIACLLEVKFYDWAKRDWLGIEAIKAIKGYNGHSRVGKLTSWILRKSDPVVFLFLSIKCDPFITMVYFRHAAYSGMNRRDWKIFVGSVLIANIYWVLTCYMGISLVEWMVKVMWA